MSSITPSSEIYFLEKKDISNRENIIQIKNLSKIYYLSSSSEEEPVHALKDINLHSKSEYFPIKKGEFVMIRGPSGGGKTTLLNILGTLDSDFTGEYELLNEKITKYSNDEELSSIRLQKIGFVFQTFNLISTMTAIENVVLPMTIHNLLNRKEQYNRGLNLLKSVGLEDRVNHLPSELSGGEQQRVAIARALSNTPSVLLLDEPTGDLDSNSTIEVMNLLLSINKYGPNVDDSNKRNSNEPTTIIMVTHNPELECYADRILYVQDGVFSKQIINEYQIPLTLDEYLSYINKK